MRKRELPREHRLNGGVTRTKKRHQQNGRGHEGWVRAARILLLLIALSYLALVAAQLPEKYHVYGMYGVVVAGIMMLMCVSDNFHHICRGVNELLRLAGTATLEIGNAIARTGRGIIAMGEKLKDFGELVHSKIDHLLQIKR